MTPDNHTIQEFYIDVGDGHELYVHDWGNPKATTPIMYLHGGPGSSTSDSKKKGFDPSSQRVVFFDQRGSGRSLPYGALEHNTTQDLIDDIEKIAIRLGLEQFVLRGGSWGSTLALTYGIKYPHRVRAMVLDGILTASKAEIDWVEHGLFKTFYPEVWEKFLARTPSTHHAAPSAYHQKRILKGDEAEVKESVYAYYCMEGGVLTLNDTIPEDDFDTFDPLPGRIEIHYLSNYCFLPENYILDNAGKLTMPIYMVQGRYDMVCPPAAAYELAQRLPKGELIMTTSGHMPERESKTVVKVLLRELTR